MSYCCSQGFDIVMSYRVSKIIQQIAISFSTSLPPKITKPISIKSLNIKIETFSNGISIGNNILLFSDKFFTSWMT